jgi:hypothetical protein
VTVTKQKKCLEERIMIDRHHGATLYFFKFREVNVMLVASRIWSGSLFFANQKLSPKTQSFFIHIKLIHISKTKRDSENCFFFVHRK